MAAEGDIVFSIGAEVSALIRGGQQGEKALADLEREAKKLERELGKIGTAGVEFQRSLNQMTGVTRDLGKSAHDSAAAFEAFDRSKAQVDALRASIDPLFAASRRYEGALRTLDTALEQGAISARQHAQMTDQLAASMLRADAATDRAAGIMGRMGVSANNARGAVQNVGYQIQDFAVQVGAGTSATQAFAQQFPQMASVFGPWGVAIGTIAAVAIPALGLAFAAASENADKLSAAMERQKTIAEGLTAVFTALRVEREMLQSGAETEAEQNAMNEIKRLAQERVGLERELAALHEEANANLGMINTSELQRLQAALATNEANRKGSQAQLESIQRERALRDAVKASQAEVEEKRRIMALVASMDVSGPWRNVLGPLQAAIDKANEYAAASGMIYSGRGGDPRDFGANPGGSNTFDTENFSMPQSGGAGGGGGGGGGGQNPVQAQLEALRQQLMTQEQAELESHTRRQEMLQQALEQRLVTQQEYAALMEQSQQQHGDKMSAIDVYRYGSAEQQAGRFFGDMANALQGGNERMQKIGKKFAAAEALVNAWRAFSQTMADPRLPFFAKIPSAVSALAAGMSAVSALGGGGGGGGVRGASGAAAAAQAAPSPTQTMNLSFTNDPWGSTEKFARQMAVQLNEAQRNGMIVRLNVI